jgi:WD40 repeat protein
MMLTTLSGHGDRVISASFSADGSRIVTASADKTARVWDAATGDALTVLAGHANWVNSAAFNADGSRVVTASLDQTARIWQLHEIVLTPADQRQAYVCGKLLIGARSFDDKEMGDPFLHNRNDLRSPCARVGPLSPSFYRQGAIGLVATIRHLLWD